MKKSAAVSAAIAEIDQKIETLQAARQVLMSLNGAVEVVAAQNKRKMSPAGRRAVAAAQKKRWADYKRLQRAEAKSGPKVRTAGA